LTKETKNKAPSWRRIVAYILDALIASSPTIVFFMFGVFGAKYWYGLSSGAIFGAYVLFQLFSIVYLLFKDSLFFGRSIGKLIMGLQVVNESNKVCSIGKAVGRNAFFLIPLFPIIELIVMLADKKGRRIGDKAAGTKVIISQFKTKYFNTYSAVFLSVFFGLIIILYGLFVFGGYTSFNYKYNNFVYLQPTNSMSRADLMKSKEIIMSRLDVEGYKVFFSKFENDGIVLQIPDNLVSDTKTLSSVLEQGKFEAKIGDNVAFTGGNKDILAVCRNSACSQVDSTTCSRTGDGQYSCNFWFQITLSQKAANKLAELTRNLGIIPGVGGGYLTENLSLMLDDQLVDQLIISSGLRGKVETQIQIQGSGKGATMSEAHDVAVNDMRKLQTVLITGNLFTKFGVLKFE